MIISTEQYLNESAGVKKNTAVHQLKMHTQILILHILITSCCNMKVQTMHT